MVTHLLAHGRITDATARQQFGAFRLADAIYRLRRGKRHLLPKNTKITTLTRLDLNQTPFAEYRLVKEQPQHG